jgi:hypothetical protein
VETFCLFKIKGGTGKRSIRKIHHRLDLDKNDSALKQLIGKKQVKRRVISIVSLSLSQRDLVTIIPIYSQFPSIFSHQVKTLVLEEQVLRYDSLKYLYN